MIGRTAEMMMLREVANAGNGETHADSRGT